jgi:sulfide:quinone oxidoreductase
MARILILGGGFGGLMSAEYLAELSAEGHIVTLVSPSEKFTFYPALVRLAFGDCLPDNISFKLLDKLHHLKVRFLQGEVTNIKTNLKKVQTAGNDFNGEISYDYLIVALGRRLATEKIRGFFDYSQHLLSVKAAQKFGDALNEFDKGRIVVGLSPQSFLPVPVCETAFALAKRFRNKVESNEVSINVVFPQNLKKIFGDTDLPQKLEKSFAKHSIKLITDFAVKEITEQSIISIEDRKLGYDLLMLFPPFRGQAVISNLHVTDELDFVKVDEFMRVIGLENTYAVGDITSFEGQKLAYSAVRQAKIAAQNIIDEVHGKTPKTSYQHIISVVIDEAENDTTFIQSGNWDDTLEGLKEGKMWSKEAN